MRLGIFGGSFNPPHNAHLTVAERAMQAAELGRVVWIPAARSPFKVGDETMAPAAVRLEMVRAIVRGNVAFEASDIELRREGPSYTVVTLRELREERPEDELFLVLGGDSLAGFASWREPREILALARLVVYRRPGVDQQAMGAVPDWVLDEVLFVDDAVPMDVSATEIRDEIRQGTLPAELVPDSVLRIIEREGLYGYSQ